MDPEERYRKEDYLDAPSQKQNYCYGCGALAEGKQDSRPSATNGAQNLTWHELPMA